MLQEYYFLSVLMEYVNLTDDPEMLNQTANDDYEKNVLNEQEVRFNTSETEFIQGDVGKLKHQISKLLVSYIGLMIKCKKTVNVSYDDVADSVFKYQEAEKHSFTDRLKNMNDEDRTMDTILKNMKMGPLYSIGMSKGLKTYDPNTFEHDKMVADKVETIRQKLGQQNHGAADDMDVQDALAEEEVQEFIDNDEFIMDTRDDDAGDPWGDDNDDGDGNY